MNYKIRLRLGSATFNRVVRFRINSSDFGHVFGRLEGYVHVSVIESFVSPRTFQRLKPFITHDTEFSYFRYEVISIDYVD